MNPPGPGGLPRRSGSLDSLPSQPTEAVPDAAADSGLVDPSASRSVSAERARRAAELPERPRSPLPPVARGAANATDAPRDDHGLPGLLIGLQLDSIALMARAADAGFIVTIATAGASGAASASAVALAAGAPETLRAHVRTNIPQPTARRPNSGNRAVAARAPAAPASRERPSNASIEALDSALESWVAAAGPAELQSRRGSAQEIIERVHAYSLPTLDLAGEGLDCLPECLGLLTSVHNLALDDNLLMDLPAVLPPNLRRICAANNFLAHFPAALPTSVTHVDLSCNTIRSIPDTLPEGLIALNLSANGLQSLPASLPATLRHARFDLNPIDEIPNWVFRMHPDTRLQFSTEPLSGAARHAVFIHAALSVGSQGRGPTLVMLDYDPASGIDAGAQSAEASPVARSVLAGRWDVNHQAELFLHAPGSPNAGWRGRLGTEPDDNRSHFIDLLEQLPYTAEFSHPLLHRSFCTRIAALLRQLEADQPARALCFAMAAAWSGTCEDGVALAFDNMEMALYCAELERGAFSSTELAALGGQMMRYEALERFTVTLPGARHMDLTEAALRLRTALIDVLDLPTNCRSMTYAEFAETSCLVDQATIDAARAHVESETGGDALIDYLANWQPWITRLKRDYPQRAGETEQSNAALKRSLIQRMEQLDESKESMRSGAYQQAAKALADQYNAIDGFDPSTRRELTILSVHAVVSALNRHPPADAPVDPA